MHNNSRTQNSIINSFFGMTAYLFVMVTTMATRIAFARYLGEELLGLNSLYTSVLQILQITELGISNAMIIFLYEPVKNADREKTKALIHLYKNVYNIFAGFLLLLGLGVQFFIIPHIVNVNTIDMKNVQGYFFLFLIAIVCSYLYAYNKSIFYAEQKNRIISIVNAAQKVIVGILQVFVIYKFKNYYIFLLLMIAGNLTENLICHFMVLKEHPYLSENVSEKLNKTEQKKIIDLIKPIFVVRIADKVLSQSDSLIINGFIDIITLGMYTNYHTIYNACIGLYNPIGSALTSSYGNLAVDANAKEKYTAYLKSYAPFHYIAVVFSCLFLAFIQDFIYIAYGARYVLSDSLSIVMTVYVYLTLVKTIYYSYQNAMGLHKLDQKQMIAQVPFNIVISIILAKMIGLNGIIIGTILSILIFSFGFKGKYLYEFAFHEDTKKYFLKTTKDFTLSGFLFAVVYLFTCRFRTISIGAVILKVIVMSICIGLVSLVLFSIDREFREFVLGLQRKLLKNKTKSEK